VNDPQDTHGIRVHVFEEGYFRPHWITLEQGGVNAHSPLLSKTPEWYLAQTPPDIPLPRPISFPSPFWQRAAHDIAYNLCTLADPILHKGVQHHVPYPIVCEYLAYLRRAAWVLWCKREARATTQTLISECDQHPYYLFPLQLDSDAQIVHHSPYPDMASAMHHVVESFARAAPARTRLIVKRHPLDPGLIHYRQQLRQAAHALGIAERVFFLESGQLDPLIKASQGIVTVNSTVGNSALNHRRPVIALGTALYALPGLTFQGNLDDFWHASPSTRPDWQLWQAFRHIITTRTQVNGGVHSTAGITLAVEGAVQRLGQGQE